MLGKKISEFASIKSDESVLELYKCFTMNSSLNWVIITTDGNKPLGVVRREDLSDAQNAKSISDFIKLELKVIGSNYTDDSVDKIIFENLKNEIFVFPIVNDNGEVCGVWERIANYDLKEEFYKKFLQIKQAGYSLADWFHYYGYKKIGIHSFGEEAELLASELQNTDIEIMFVAGNSNEGGRGLNGKIIEKPFSMITIEEKKSCDVIINAFYFLDRQVEYLYKHHANYTNVVSLFNIADEIWSYEYMSGYMIKIANFIASRGRKVYIFDYMRLADQKNRSDRENRMIREGYNGPKTREIINTKNSAEMLKLQPIIMEALNSARLREGAKTVSFEDYAENYPNVTKVIPGIKFKADILTLLDMNSKYCNVVNGERVTVACKKAPKKKIHFFGKSWVFGHHCSDEYTIPSAFQKIINENGLEIQTHNHAIGGLREEKIANIMKYWDKIAPKDDVFVLCHMFGDYGNLYNIKERERHEYIHQLSTDRPHDYGEIWVDTGHVGEGGSELLARQIYNKIFVENGESVPGQYENKYNHAAGRKIYEYDTEVSVWSSMPEFKKYQEYLISNKSRNGAIVMNCNPFTLGHRYLIETAAKQCNELYIFVVEEDKSIFPFEDRFELVKKGTADIKNVKVLHSGKFIISALTFPGYFSKSVNNNAVVDTSNDVVLFAEHIAPTLGITTRFAGEEPIDMITKQYNEKMKEILPQHGIEFVEIPRKEFGSNVISASRVRKLLEEKNFEEIEKLVPETTLVYLKERVK